MLAIDQAHLIEADDRLLCRLGARIGRDDLLELAGGQRQVA